jgi:hypothetical protein
MLKSNRPNIIYTAYAVYRWSQGIKGPPVCGVSISTLDFSPTCSSVHLSLQLLPAANALAHLFSMKLRTATAPFEVVHTFLIHSRNRWVSAVGSLRSLSVTTTHLFDCYFADQILIDDLMLTFPRQPCPASCRVCQAPTCCETH